MKLYIDRASDPLCDNKPCKKAKITTGEFNPHETGYLISIDSLKDLLELMKEVGNIVIYTDAKKSPSHITIYDDYIE